MYRGTSQIVYLKRKPRRSLLPLLSSALILSGWIQAASGQPKGAPQTSESAPRYVIGPGDILQVDVWKEPEASAASVVVRPDGTISLPLVKEISAGGRTLHELEQQLTSLLAQQIREPDVTVLVKEINSQKVYLIGAVRKEGPIIMHSPLTVLQAIAEGGGITEYAKRGSIYILRQIDSKQTKIAFDYSAVIKGEHPEQNIVLHPSDTIVVP
jgi:polysaccharide export outer membrane protein